MDSGLGIGGLAISKDEVASSSFDLFSPIEIENSIKRANKITTRPIANTNSRGPFNFVFPADPQKWTDVESLRLSGKIKLRKSAGGILTDFADDDNEISTVNNFFQSLFSSVTCTLNGVEISDPSANWYPYKSYIETILSYSNSTKDGRLKANCYIKDDATKFDTIGVIDAQGKITTESTNEGYIKRRNFFKNSKATYFNIPIHSDICTLRKYLPPNSKLEFEFHRGPDAFSLLSPITPEKCKIVIQDLELSLTRYTPSSQVEKFYLSNLTKKKKQVLPIDRSLIKTYTVQTGQTDLSHYNLISGHQLPEQIIICMTDQVSHQGDIKKNPFNFKHFDCSEASIVVNGAHEPSEPYKLQIDNGNYIDLYSDFLINMGISNEDRDCGITPEDYVGGNFFLIFDRSKEKCNRYHRHPHDSGSIDINIRTTTNLPSTVTVLVYATYSSEIVIDDTNTVTIKKSF